MADQLLNEAEARAQVTMRPGMNPPKSVFGHCAITGEWGKCVLLDLGSIMLPSTEDAEPLTAEVSLTISEMGLEKLLSWSKEQASPIPMDSPELSYGWAVVYTDGSGLTQFCRVGDEELEHASTEIDFERVIGLFLIARNGNLAQYKFERPTGKFYRQSPGDHRLAVLDTGYVGSMPENAQIVYARKVHKTFGSDAQSGERGIECVANSVLQLIGWKVGGLPAMLANEPTPGCVIAVDSYGNWRPYHYV